MLMYKIASLEGYFHLVVCTCIYAIQYQKKAKENEWEYSKKKKNYIYKFRHD